MRWSIQEVEGGWEVQDANGNRVGDVYTSYFGALGAIGALAQSQLAEGGSSGAFRSEAIPEGEETSDGRFIEEGAMYWRVPPLPLMLQTSTDIGHFGAELAGRITGVSRDGNTIVLVGDFDESDRGAEGVRILEERGRFGVSVDLGQMDYEVECTSMGEDGWCEEELFRVTRGELIGATMTPFPAFADAFIELAGAGTSGAVPEETDNAEGEGESEPEGNAEAATLVPIAAAGAPVAPPVEWFERPAELDEGFTWVSITEQGRIFGYIAPWGVCHIGDPQGPNVCVDAPRSVNDYAYFRTGELRPSDCDCDPVAVGRLTMDTGHAARSLDPRHTASHYDDTGAVVADIACGEDTVGVWYSGALRPGVNDEQLRALRAAEISGDWRRIGGGLELVAALVVNVGGFKVPRVAARVASGEVVALVAAGHNVKPIDPAEARLRRIESEVQRLALIADPLRAQSARERVAAIRAPGH